MGNLDGLLEEVVGNKIEMTGPLIDSYLKQLGSGMRNKLSLSKSTGLLNTITMFILWPIYRHIFTLVRGYGEDIQTNREGTKHYVTICSADTASKLFLPARFAGECYLAYRHFKRVPSKLPGGRLLSVYNGKSVVVVTPTTPLCLDYNTTKEHIVFTFYVFSVSIGNHALASTIRD